MRGDHDRVAPLLTRVRAAVDTSDYRGFAARTWHAAGLAALAQGNYVTAYAQISHLFAADGTPLHHHFSYLAIADLAAAAARAERRPRSENAAEARTRPRERRARAAAGTTRGPGPRTPRRARRRPHALRRASSRPRRGQLAVRTGPASAGLRRVAAAASGGSSTPSPILGTALETFRRLGAAPWTRRAESELRACGVTVNAPPAAPGALDDLTAQQLEIIILAAQGLTNGEIADRLFLSPRTVASHPLPLLSQARQSPAVTNSATSSTSRAHRREGSVWVCCVRLDVARVGSTEAQVTWPARVR